MYWENQPELPSDKGSNRSRGATHDIGRGDPLNCMETVELYVEDYMYRLSVLYVCLKGRVQDLSLV